MSSLYFDYLNRSKNLSKQERIDEFLNHILKLFKENYGFFEKYPENKKKVVYNELVKYGLNVTKDFREVKNNQLQLVDLQKNGCFNDWISDLKNIPNLQLFMEKRYNCGMLFKSGNLPNLDNYEFIYLSLDSEHIFLGVKELMEFMSNNNIVHQTKISRYQRTDGFVIKINKDDKESLNKIKNFIKNNQYIQEGLNQLNPFMPGDDKLTSISNCPESYSNQIASHISKFVDQKINSNKVSASDFLEYAYSIPNQQIRHMLVNNLESFSQNDRTEILNNAIICTYKKYGYHAVEKALDEAINNNNFNYFSRYDVDEPNNGSVNYREQLVNNLKSADIVNVIYQKLEKDKYALDQYNDKETLNLYISNVIMKYQVDILDQAVSVTCQNHDVSWANKALQGYVQSGDSKGFSRYDSKNDINYRQLLSKYVHSNDIYRLAAMSLMEKGVEIGELDISEIIPAYVGVVGVEEIRRHNL